jgi:hypothetical protein
VSGTVDYVAPRDYFQRQDVNEEEELHKAIQRSSSSTSTGIPSSATGGGSGNDPGSGLQRGSIPQSLILSEIMMIRNSL